MICSPYGIAERCGNSIASERLRRGFEQSGHRVHVLEHSSTIGRMSAKEKVATFSPDAVLVMHGWRCREAFFGIRSSPNPPPIIVSFRGTDVNEMLSDQKKASSIIEILHLADKITVFNKTMRDIILINSAELLSGTVHIIPNGLSLPPSNGDYRAKLGLPQEVPVIVGLAGVRPVKGVMSLIDYLVMLKEHVPSLLYVHAGPIIDRTEGELFLAACSKNDWIFYAGEIPHEEVASFLRAGTLFVSASLSEGMPHAVREAMLAGVPCLLSLNHGHRSIAGGDEVLFFHDRPSFVDASLRLLNDQALRQQMASRGRERVLIDCEDNNETDCYLRLFSELIEKKRAGGRHET